MKTYLFEVQNLKNLNQNKREIETIKKYYLKFPEFADERNIAKVAVKLGELYTLINNNKNIIVNIKKSNKEDKNIYMNASQLLIETETLIYKIQEYIII